MPSNYTLDYETTDDESSLDNEHLPPVPTRANGVKRTEERWERECDERREEGSEAGATEAEEVDDTYSIDLNDEEFKVKRTDENEHLFDIDGNYVGPIDRDFESCSDD